MSDQNSTFDRAFLEQQRKRLEALRKQLLEEEQNLAEELAFEKDHRQEAEEPEEQAQRMAQNDIDQALHNLDAPRLRAIERALQKIEDGTYGTSVLSGAPIPRARLEAVPEALLTIEEEQQKERKHRR